MTLHGEVPGINLVFGADNLHRPLTGIGRYSLELARRLEFHKKIDEIRYFSLGRWVVSPISDLVNVNAPRVVSNTASIKAWLGSQSLAVKAYNALSPTMFKWRLRELSSSDVYHSPSFFAPICKARKVATVHDLSHEISPEFHPTARVELMSQALPRSLAITDHVITVSETVRLEVIERYGISPDRVSAIHLAADASYRLHTLEMLTPAMSALRLRPGGYCLFVGTVEPRKNVKRLVEAYAALPADLRADCPLVIAGGPGWNSADIHEAIAKGVEAGWLRYLSFVEQRWLPALYAGARLMAYPSLYEGFGLPIVEAMASGTPVLTSNVSCMPEVAGGAALLVTPTSVDELVEGLRMCLTDTHWQEQAAQNGLMRASQLSWDRCAEMTVQVYESVLS